MIKKVLISAAGRGTRMLDLSKDKPKHLIEVNKKPFLYYLLDNLKKAGFEEIIMVVGYKKEFMESFLAEYKDDFHITLVNQFDVLGEDRYGTACPLECTKDLLQGQSFLAVYGDNLYSVEDLKRLNIDDGYSYIAGLAHETPEKYGVLQVEGGLLKKIVEKPAKPIGNLINTGLYKFSPEVFDHLDKIDLSPRGEYELTDVINILAKKDKVKAIDLRGVWLDFGKPGDIKKVEQYLDAEKNN
ncbi:NTP transferase domain-containing protein [Candidatus Parcubacteria bacterium]|jgi:bifunctional UDP-N-acetylglucosamine pyrophosphorylase/glucosamine-1-phosphate N-acetyltransferase|nr:NTP transferase domain-containing protein [Candidatus Parcubacteria bacterium]MBT7228433.1 NTP transferase domain-containing protein [Candidatus Parcubacteria bacterium]